MVKEVNIILLIVWCIIYAQPVWVSTLGFCLTSLLQVCLYCLAVACLVPVLC